MLQLRIPRRKRSGLDVQAMADVAMANVAMANAAQAQAPDPSSKSPLHRRNRSTVSIGGDQRPCAVTRITDATGGRKGPIPNGVHRSAVHSGTPRWAPCTGPAPVPGRSSCLLQYWRRRAE